jgi:hypothetical protein
MGGRPGGGGPGGGGCADDLPNGKDTAARAAANTVLCFSIATSLTKPTLGLALLLAEAPQRLHASPLLALPLPRSLEAQKARAISFSRARFSEIRLSPRN